MVVAIYFLMRAMCGREIKDPHHENELIALKQRILLHIDPNRYGYEKSTELADPDYSPN